LALFLIKTWTVSHQRWNQKDGVKTTGIDTKTVFFQIFLGILAPQSSQVLILISDDSTSVPIILLYKSTLGT
jgi:hypothetical protein